MTPHSIVKKKKRWMPKFGLKTLLLMSLLAAIPLSWLGKHLSTQKLESNFVQQCYEISEDNGYESFCTTWYDYELNEKGKYSNKFQPKGPKWLRSIFGDRLFSRIEKVRIEGSGHFEKLGLARLGELKHLTIERGDITDLQSVAHLTNLRSLKILNCSELTSLKGLEHLVNLRDVEISTTKPIRSFAAISDLNQLESLVVSCGILAPNPNRNEPKPLGPLPNLEILSLVNWPWTDFSVLSDSPKLKSVDLHGASKLQSLDGIENATALEKITIEDAPQLKSLSSLQSLTKVDSIVLHTCGIEDFRDVPNSTVNQLDVYSCQQLGTLDGIEKMSGLTDIHFTGCRELCDIEAIGELDLVERLSFVASPKVVDWKSIKHLKSLGSLSITKNEHFRSLDIVKGIPKLTYLSVQETAISNLEGIENHTKLRHLKLEGCRRLRTLEGMPPNKQIESLNLEGCVALESLEGLSSLEKLRSFNAKGCKSLDVNNENFPESLRQFYSTNGAKVRIPKQ